MVKIGNLYRWIYGHITGKPTNFNWVIEGKLAGSGLPTSSREIRWLAKQQGIRSIVTIKEKPLPSEWFSTTGRSSSSSSSTNNNNPKIDYFHISVEDYGAPSVEELDYVVNYITRQIDKGKPVMVHCSGGRGRTGTILAAYLIKNQKGDMNADKVIKKLSSIREGKSIQSKDQEKIVFSYEQYINKSQTRKDDNNSTSNSVS
jgi:atypical dual specificity phosphatase